MGTVTGIAYTGLLTIDLSDVKSVLVDLAPGEMVGLRKEQPGMSAVIAELANSVPALGDKAGISPTVYQHFLTSTADITTLRGHRSELEKAVEVVKETEAKLENDRENDISMMVDSVKSTSNRTGDKALVAAFEKMIAYNAQIAEKAAATRRKNEEAKKAEAKKPEEGKGP